MHGSFGGVGGAQCASAGDQVTIKTASGKVLATPTLGQQVMKHMTVSGVKVPVLEYQYRARVPRDARYAVSVGGMSPYYASLKQLEHGLDLSC